QRGKCPRHTRTITAEYPPRPVISQDCGLWPLRRGMTATPPQQDGEEDDSICTTFALEELASVRNLLVRHDQHDRAIAVGKAERQHLGHELADLARREIDDRRHLATDQAFGCVMHGELGGGFLEADLGA